MWESINHVMDEELYRVRVSFVQPFLGIAFFSLQEHFGHHFPFLLSFFFFF